MGEDEGDKKDEKDEGDEKREPLLGEKIIGTH